MRGRSYRFNLDESVSGYPFYFTTKVSFLLIPVWAIRLTGKCFVHRSRASGERTRTWASIRFVRQGAYRTDTGVIEFRVDTNAPDRLYYASGSASYMGGMVNVVNGESVILFPYGQLED